MKTGTQGKDIIKHYEGLKLKAYLCPANVWTIGYGHTATAKKGMVITTDEAEELLARDLIVFENGLKNLVKGKLNQEMFDALISFIYNLGLGTFQRSTLRANINRGELFSASDEFNKYVFAGGRKLNGLVTRRGSERNLFNIGVIKYFNG